MKLIRFNRRPVRRSPSSSRRQEQSSSPSGLLWMFMGIFIGIAGTLFLYPMVLENTSLNKIKTLVQKEIKSELQQDFRSPSTPTLQIQASHPSAALEHQLEPELLAQIGESQGTQKPHTQNQSQAQTQQTQTQNQGQSQSQKPKIVIAQHSSSTDNEKSKKYEFYNLLPGMEVQLPEEPQHRNENRNENRNVNPSANQNVPQNINPNVPVNVNSSNNVNNQQRQERQSQKNPYLQNTNTAKNIPSPLPNLENLGVVGQKIKEPANRALATREPAKSQSSSTEHLKKSSPSSLLPLQAKEKHLLQEKQPQPEKVLAMNKNTTHPVPRVESKLAAAHYVIQAGIFALPTDATDLNKRLNTKGFKPRIQKMKTKEGVTAYRVILGPYATEAMALNQKRLLEQNKVHGILILKQL